MAASPLAASSAASRGGRDRKKCRRLWQSSPAFCIHDCRSLWTAIPAFPTACNEAGQGMRRWRAASERQVKGLGIPNLNHKPHAQSLPRNLEYNRGRLVTRNELRMEKGKRFPKLHRILACPRIHDPTALLSLSIGGFPAPQNDELPGTQVPIHVFASVIPLPSEPRAGVIGIGSRGRRDDGVLGERESRKNLELPLASKLSVLCSHTLARKSVWKEGRSRRLSLTYLGCTTTTHEATAQMRTPLYM